MGYKEKPAQAGKRREDVLSERIEERVALISWGATHSVKGVADDLKQWAVGSVPSSKRQEFEEFLRDPKGKEFSLIFRSEADAIKFARFLEGCGLFRRVDGYLNKPTPEDILSLPGGATDKAVTLTLTAVAREYPKPLTGREGKALEKIESGKTSYTVSDEEMAELGVRKTKEGELYISSDPLAMRPEKKKEYVELPRKFRDSEGDVLNVIPDEKTREGLEAARRSGKEYSFMVTGDSRAKFLEEHLKGEGLRMERTGKRKWEITINRTELEI
jgi:hypothetical protein